ncbi:pilus assembly protein [Methylocucumis oryzae]|uniref:PilY1 beta-propeller domain-containing protein n=1 Tax=Methylocucumis oryzae TaxID=1632867 RepID=A0A0F3IHZ2_9GAMM|nr:PilC/PilY family type IV pilus protein [Methylocucumis oryzae]KJV05074.1 hypothetical protein VZ94_20810 [Methylocucumis oryzae]
MKYAKLGLLALLGYSLSTPVLALTFSQTPLYISSTEPRVMIVSSRDHQLSIKAYTDYSDINGDGNLDITYTDTIEYYGYFDANKCYDYSSSQFNPTGPVSTGTHQCDGTKWSGNFLNWASMTRMDVVRKTFYGGYRSTDTTGAAGVTVLERHFLPVDIHAFVKVYNPGSSATLNYYVPSSIVGSNTSLSFCNVSNSTNTNSTGTSAFTIPNPLIRVAAGSWPQWDSSEVTQCATGSGTRPSSVIGDYVARVKVCDSTIGLESNCKIYTHPTTGVQTIKPIGLLQQYGDVNVDKRVRFGLMTGSYSKNKSGGVLRKNVGFIANNNNYDVTSSSICGNNNSSDEIDVCTGAFINQGSSQAGIINTLNRLRIAGFRYNSSGGNASHQYSCNSPGILTFSNGQCVDWGNPLSELYLESLRYFAGVGVTSTFNTDDSTYLASLPQLTWNDPLPSNEWCALCNIIVLSTGLNSFDTDQPTTELASFTPTGGSTAINAISLTNTIGGADYENINGQSYLIGDNGSTANKQCTAKTITNLATARGICPEVPGIEGGYNIAGLAYATKSIDLRPNYASKRNDRWGATGINKDWALRQPITTYAVQLAESLPSFSIPVGASGSITFLPSCQANSTGSAPAWTSTATGWRNCSLTNLFVNDNVAMSDVGTDTSAKSKTCSGNGTTSQCFTIAWEDSTWGNDYDMDVMQRLGYCVGSACSTFKMLCPDTSSAYATIGPWTGISSSQIVIATCAMQAQAGHALTFGYTLTGTTADGPYYPILRPGGSNFNVGSTRPSGVTAANSSTYNQGSSTAKLLENPLWYAAKYGGFIESNPTSGTPQPDLVSEWDTQNNLTGAAGADGQPDNYFNIRNPANLIKALSNVFDRASQPDASSSSVATNSTNLKVKSRIYQAKFSSADWSGQLISYKINTTPLITFDEEWDAGELINSLSSRVILTKGATGDGVAFDYGNLTTSQQALLNQNENATVDDCGEERVAYLRGDTSNEGSSSQTMSCGVSTVTRFRKRNSSILGDTVNSNPWYIGPPSAGYSDASYAGYNAFRLLHKDRTPMVYAGANDGMLHGFNAQLDFSNDEIGVPTADAGKEKLAYVPTEVYKNLPRLSSQTYNKNHRYFVDGSPMSADVDLDSSATNDWRTVLISGMNSGGKGYFALDVTDPATFSESGASPANTLLWEFNEADMGYAFNLPPVDLLTNDAKQIVRMANGKWAAILGNGYNSSLGKAVLYIVFIEDGIDGTWASSDYIKIVADAPVSQDNGLSTPIPFDSDGDGIVDTVYAGDLKGNMWKFLVGPNYDDETDQATASVTSSPATWKVGLSGNPLFIAKDSGGNIQPITTPPEITSHPVGGQLVLFGTGKYLETSDNTNTSTQTFYGIWDRNKANVTVGNRSSSLLEQTVTDTETTSGGTYRTISQKQINWRPSSGGSNADCTGSCTPTHMGWFLDLPTVKERAIAVPKLINGIIFFNTLVPSTEVCDAGGTGWLMSLNYESGGQVTTHAIYDTNASGSINKDDQQKGGLQIGAAVGGSTIIQNQNLSNLDASSNVGLAVQSLAGGVVTGLSIDLGPKNLGRTSWHELIQQ